VVTARREPIARAHSLPRGMLVCTENMGLRNTLAAWAAPGGGRGRCL